MNSCIFNYYNMILSSRTPVRKNKPYFWAERLFTPFYWITNAVNKYYFCIVFLGDSIYFYSVYINYKRFIIYSICCTINLELEMSWKRQFWKPYAQFDIICQIDQWCLNHSGSSLEIPFWSINKHFFPPICIWHWKRNFADSCLHYYIVGALANIFGEVKC